MSQWRLGPGAQRFEAGMEKAVTEGCWSRGYPERVKVRGPEEAHERTDGTQPWRHGDGAPGRGSQLLSLLNKCTVSAR